MNRRLQVGLLTLAPLAPAMVSHEALAGPFVLSNGVGESTLSVGVDGYGAFGSGAGMNTSDARFDPPGMYSAAGTTFESAVAFRIGERGKRTSLSSRQIVGSAAGENPIVTSDELTANSTFTIGGIEVALTQSVTPLTAGAQSAELKQTYTMKNVTRDPIALEMLRYFDGDLQFDRSRSDGGGRVVRADGTDVVYETDNASSGDAAVPGVAVTAEGGTKPTESRYEVSSFSTLQTRIARGNKLRDHVEHSDADGAVVAPDEGYDVTLALRNLYDIAPGESGVYTTTTRFSLMTANGGMTANLEQSPPPPPPVGQPVPIPLPPAGWASLIMLSGMGGWRLWRRRSITA